MGETGPLGKKKGYGLRTRVAVMVSAVVMLVLLMLYVIFRNQIIPQTRHALEEKANAVARTVALMPVVAEGLSQGRSREIQAYTSQITGSNDILFVVVIDMDGIRYSHPDPSLIGKPFAGGGQEAALRGEESVSEGEGMLGKSVRSFVPVYNDRGNQVGAVVVGVSLERVHRLVRRNDWTIIAILLSGALLGAGGAVVLARKIKNMMLGFEPTDITRLLEERSAMLQSVREGIIAVDHEARITMINVEAERLLGTAGITGGVMSRHIGEYWPELHLEQVLATGEAKRDQLLELNGITVLSSSVPIIVDGEIAGAIATFRDKTELAVLAERLSGISVYADALRAGAHEFMNKLHVIMGMVHMGLYDDLRQYISGTVSNYQQEIGQITSRIKDPVMAGFLLGKLSRARETGIQLLLAEDSYLPESADTGDMHELITIVGNLLDNAMDALEEQCMREIELAFDYDEDCKQLICSVWDSGPGIPEALRERVFTQGFSTKGEHRGIGLYLVKTSVEKLHGRIWLRDDGRPGTAFDVEVPYAVKDEETV